MYFEQLWGRFPVVAKQGVYFKLPVNEELCFTISECDSGRLETKAKTRFVSVSTGLQAKGS